MNSIILAIFVVYLILLNFYTFALMTVDKKRARSKQRRIPEKKLFLLSTIGGALGTWIGMKVWHHKTKHQSFVVGIPYRIVWNVVMVALVWSLLKMNANIG